MLLSLSVVIVCFISEEPYALVLARIGRHCPYAIPNSQYNVMAVC